MVNKSKKIRRQRSKDSLICFFICLLTSLFFCFLIPFPCFAHKPSDSYITLKRVNNEVVGKWDIALKDLEYALGLDDNSDGKITWGELRLHHNQIADYALSHFKMKVKGRAYKNKIINQEVDNHTDGAYTVINFKIDCPIENNIPTEFDLEYSLFFDLDESHRGLLNIEHKGKTLTEIFSPEKKNIHINLNSLNTWHQFIDFIKEGIWHIWIGIDHILFLLALLLPAVLKRENNEWLPVINFRKAFWNVFKVVTAFTLAHSVTLSLAVLGIIQLPSRLIESTIAFSVIVAALNNIFPVVKEGRWIAAYLFGLIHGFGFASVLMDLNLSKNSLLVSLFSFNLGVEIGQLAIVLLFLPVAFNLKNSWAYQKPVFVGGSCIISLIALIWFIERAFNLTLLPM